MLISNLKFRPVVARLKFISLWMLLLGAIFGCRASLITVEEISQKKVGKTVYLTGKVEHVAPLVDRAAYQLKDITGKAWVVTAQNPPTIGQQISIKGKIEYQSLPVAEQEFGDFYIVEVERLPSPADELKQ